MSRAVRQLLWDLPRLCCYSALHFSSAFRYVQEMNASRVKTPFFPAAHCIPCEKKLKNKIKLLIKQISSEGVCFREKMSATWKTTELKIHVLLSHCKLQYFVWKRKHFSSDTPPKMSQGICNFGAACPHFFIRHGNSPTVQLLQSFYPEKGQCTFLISKKVILVENSYCAEIEDLTAVCTYRHGCVYTEICSF